MEIVILGTSSMVPTQDRNHTALMLSYKDEKILFDCGEGTQRQFRYAKLTPTKLTRILITHWHGDHVLGLPGLFLTLGAQNYQKTLDIYGPTGTQKNFEQMLNFFPHRKKISYVIHDIERGTVFENEEFMLIAAPVVHTTRTLAYAFIEKDRWRIKKSFLKKEKIKPGPILKKLQRGDTIIINGKKITPKEATEVVKGKKVVLITDTKICDAAVALAQDADILICEATYGKDLVKEAEEYKHLTAHHAAEIAKKAKAKKLILIHFSQRYKDSKVLEKEAKEIFPNTIAAKDLLRITL